MSNSEEFEALKQAAEGGDAEARLKLEVMHIMDLKEAAEQGDPETISDIIMMYEALKQCQQELKKHEIQFGQSTGAEMARLALARAEGRQER